MKLLAYVLWCLGWPLVAKFGFDVNMVRDGFVMPNMIVWAIWLLIGGTLSDLVRSRFSD